MHRAFVSWRQLAHDSWKLNTHDRSNRWHGACDSFNVMKTIRSIFPVKGMLLALLSASSPLAIAQTADTSTGTILDSNAAPSVIPPENPASTKLTATILPIEKDSSTKGEAAFVMVGSAVSVVGRITGMQPNKRYQAVVWVPSVPAPSKQVESVVNPPSEARPPAADSVPTGSPSPATPAAGQGSAGPANRPSAATLMPSSPQSAELDLGTMVSDASGGANLNATLENKDLAAPPTGILGGFLVIKRAPPLDGTDERSPVASGVIGEPTSVIEAPAP
jgi:hypothetical protein